MNDLVSEYQQYQDATAEGKFEVFRKFLISVSLSLFCRRR